MAREMFDDDTMAAPATSDLFARRHPSTPPGGALVLCDRYQILGLIGVGGMGSVYRARDLELGEVVALKLLRREIAHAPGMLDRFRREVRLSRRVTHPNVARVFDIGEDDGERFLTMELVDGESLAAALAREGALPITRALDLLRALCAGLSAAHKAGVVHRDLKPDNVLLSRDGRVVLTDFGIARALEQEPGASATLGGLIGTPAYMAPEQVQGGVEVDERADLYALGAMFYEVLTGERAWRGDSPLGVATARLLADPPDPRRLRADLPEALARLTLRCMARSRDDRFASAGHVAEDLATLTQEAASACCAPAPPGTPGAPALPQSAPGDRTVAVLPFQNRGPDDDAYLADELTDELIDTLSMTRGLKVRSRGALTPWRRGDAATAAPELDPREIGRELGVQVVVEGSVRRRAGAVRVSARLISVAEGFQLWAKRFDRPEAEVLQINDEAARSIAEALTCGVSAPQRAPLTDGPALDLFLRGRHEYRRFWPDHLLRAIALFDQALARAPGDPKILSASALARARLWFFSGQGGADALDVAERAVASAPDLADAHFALASVRYQAYELPDAVRALKRALALSPAAAEPQALLGRILVEAGVVNDGIRRLEAGIALDPDVPLARLGLVHAFALTGRWSEADSLLREAAANPEHLSSTAGMLARTSLWRGDLHAARALMEQIPSAAASLSLTMALRAVASTEPDKRLAGLREVQESTSGGPRRRAFIHQVVAEGIALAGTGAQALSAIEDAVAAGLADLLWLERCPVLSSARDDPRYPALLEQVRRRADAVREAYEAA